MLLWHHMNRTTIMLPFDLKSKALSKAARMGLSLGELIRVSLSAFIERGKSSGDTLLSDKGIYQGSTPGDLSENHDAYLYGAKNDLP